MLPALDEFILWALPVIVLLSASPNTEPTFAVVAAEFACTIAPSTSVWPKPEHTVAKNARTTAAIVRIRMAPPERRKLRLAGRASQSPSHTFVIPQ